MKDLNISICNHWKERGSWSAIEGFLRRVGGLDSGHLPAALAPLDQLHVGQLQSTRAFAEWVGVPAGARVLDLGSGLGGPARYLASAHGATVHAVELSEELHSAAAALTARLGLAGRVTHERADIAGSRATGPFDLVWIEHLDMHVPDKRALYARARALLAAGGRVVWHDWLAGPGGEPHWPLFWSADGSISFLSAEDAFAGDLAAAGLSPGRFRPIPEETLGWLASSAEALAAALSRARRDGGGDPSKIGRLERLLAETDNARRSVGERRLVPFFAEAG